MKVNITIIPEVTLIETGPSDRFLKHIEVHYLDEEIGTIWWSNRRSCIDSVSIENPSKDPRMVAFMALVHNQEKIAKWLEEDEE